MSVVLFKASFKVSWCQLFQRTMWPIRVVILTPGFDLELLGVTFAAHGNLLKSVFYNSGVSRKLGVIHIDAFVINDGAYQAVEKLVD